MKIAIGFYGFLRNAEIIKGSQNHLIKLINNSTVENFEIYYFYSCPDKIDEFDTDFFNTEEVSTLITKEFGINFNLKFRSYKVEKYLIRAKELGYPVLTKNNLYSYRIFSMIDSIQHTNVLIDKSLFDLTLITRIDQLKNIKRISRINSKSIKSKIYLLRNSPYKSEEDAEDRIFWGDSSVLSVLNSYYDSQFDYYLNNSDLIPEKILLNYFKSNQLINRSIIVPQTNTEISTFPYKYKYSDEVFNKVNELYKMHGISYVNPVNKLKEKKIHTYSKIFIKILRRSFWIIYHRLCQRDFNQIIYVVKNKIKNLMLITIKNLKSNQKQ